MKVEVGMGVEKGGGERRGGCELAMLFFYSVEVGC
jgi:hypothetical protein